MGRRQWRQIDKKHDHRWYTTAHSTKPTYLQTSASTGIECCSFSSVPGICFWRLQRSRSLIQVFLTLLFALQCKASLNRIKRQLHPRHTNGYDYTGYNIMRYFKLSKARRWDRINDLISTDHSAILTDRILCINYQNIYALYMFISLFLMILLPAEFLWSPPVHHRTGAGNTKYETNARAR